MHARPATPDRAPDLMLWSFETQSLTPLLETPALECGAKFSPDGQGVAEIQFITGWQEKLR